MQFNGVIFMKKILYLIAASLVLSACVSPATETINNNFLDVKATQPQVVGIWTVAVGPGLSTIKLNQDGSGLMCESSGSQTMIFKIRHSNGKLFTQNGASLEIADISSEKLSAKTNYSAVSTIMDYRSDNNLELASIPCAKELR